MKYSIQFKVETEGTTADALEAALADLLESAVFPALGATLAPLTLTVKKARN